ncbi:MAG: aldo/keto reductase [Acidobacteria bacterium]|nr:aldo/keto reductase [Acidobacteriota bacterium]
MRYRRLGKTNADVSVLGFGAMRLPMIGAKGPMDSFDPKVPIDEVESTKMIHHALEQGVNYFDTAYGYHGGKSETFVGKVLREHRSKVMIATKLPVWNLEKPEDMEKIFNEQLQKLQTDYLDVYLVHGIGATTWEKAKKLGVLDFMDKLVKSEKIRFAGFSFHDEIKIFKEIIDAYDWSVCQIQFNFYDQDYQAGREGLTYAAARDIGVVVMEPLRGGRIVQKIPPQIQAIWDEAPVRKSAVEWAMRWVWNFEGVSTVLTGASSLAQLQDHTRIVKDAAADFLSAAELAVFDKVRAAYRKMLLVDCTTCGYCMPCPTGVNIPQNFSLYGDAQLFDGRDSSAFFYNGMLTPEERASACTECGECVEKCPQKIDIPKELKEVHKLLGKS